MPGLKIFLAFFLIIPIISLQAESFRTVVENSIVITPENPSGITAALGIQSSLLINLGGEVRFIRGIEVEISAPQNWLSFRGSLVMSMYNNLNPQNASGTTDMDGNRIAFEPLPARLQIVYQIPVRQSHGLRTTPYVIVPAGINYVNTFPVLFGLMPVVKGMTEDFEALTFNLTVRPILTDEGAVVLTPRFPPILRDKPFTVLIDDVPVENINDKYFLREGEHHLVILSEDYRNESRRFLVERARTLDLIIELQDPTPLLIFEAPYNALIFLNNEYIYHTREPIAVEPGLHEVRFQIGDYTVIKNLNTQRGKTYRVSLALDLIIDENEQN
ncbi:MAG: hypothetical protein FWC03_10050 [Treponema sp.]|nr:hypothetical protein [Treponema sp.]